MQTGIGGIGSAVGSIFAASSQKIGLILQARIADLNAQMEQDNAREALRQGGQQETSLRFQAGQLKSRQRATMAANGVRLDQGSALNRLNSTDYMTEADAATIRQNAAREAAGYRMASVGYGNQALMSRAAASSISPFLTGASSLLTSASKVSGDWYALASKGVPVGFGGGPKIGPLIGIETPDIGVPILGKPYGYDF